MSDISVLPSDEYLDKDYFLSADINNSATSEKTEKKIKIIKVVFVILCLFYTCRRSFLDSKSRLRACLSRLIIIIVICGRIKPSSACGTCGG